MTVAAAEAHPIIRNATKWKTPILMGIPTLGTVRIEWTNALWNIVLPVNFSTSQMIQPVPHLSTLTAMGYHVAEAQNLIIKEALFPNNKEMDWEWLLLIEDDVIVPPNILLRLAKWAHDGRFPIVSGWYNVKAEPPIPMFFRGSGNGAIYESVEELLARARPEVVNEELGLKALFADGVPTGCTMISTKLLRVAWEHSEEIVLTRMMNDGAVIQLPTREVFLTRREAGVDPQTGGYYKKLGTSDLDFCQKVIENGWLEDAGFEHAAKLEYPFPVDLEIRCGHIDLRTGRVY